MEYGIFKKNRNKKNIEIAGIWNIRGISQKNRKTIIKSKNLEYRIFLEYSKNVKRATVA